MCIVLYCIPSWAGHQWWPGHCCAEWKDVVTIAEECRLLLLGPMCLTPRHLLMARFCFNRSSSASARRLCRVFNAFFKNFYQWYYWYIYFFAKDLSLWGVIYLRVDFVKQSFYNYIAALERRSMK